MKKSELGIFDISCARFMPKPDRELYIELPDEARAPGEGDVVGRLNRGMYGFQRCKQQSEGYVVGKANPALFFNNQRNLRGAGHGNDFYVLANMNVIGHTSKVLASKNNVCERHRLGFGKHCTRTAVTLSRIIVMVASEGRSFIQIEFRSSQIHDTVN